MRALAMVWIAWTALVAAGCVLTPVDLAGRACPCADGWVCAGGVCEREGQRERDAGSTPRDGSIDAATPPTDAGVDAQIDAGTIDEDGGALDAGPLDAGPLDSGSPDAGTPDAGPGPTRCDDVHAGALFCDGFEWAYPTGRTNWQWDLLEMGEVSTVTTPAPFLGERALRATTTATMGRAAIGVNLGTAIVDGELWLRGMFFVPSALTVSGLSLLYVGTADGTAGIALQAHDGGDVAAWIGTAGTFSPTAVDIPRDRWVCLQLRVLIADTGGEVDVYVGDSRAGHFAPFDTLPLAAGGYDVVEAGIEYATETQGASTLYVDEVVLSRTRVPCE